MPSSGSNTRRTASGICPPTEATDQSSSTPNTRANTRTTGRRDQTTSPVRTYTGSTSHDNGPPGSVRWSATSDVDLASNTSRTACTTGKIDGATKPCTSAKAASQLGFAASAVSRESSTPDNFRQTTVASCASARSTADHRGDRPSTCALPRTSRDRRCATDGITCRTDSAGQCRCAARTGSRAPNTPRNRGSTTDTRRAGNTTGE